MVATASYAGIIAYSGGSFIASVSTDGITYQSKSIMSKSEIFMRGSEPVVLITPDPSGSPKAHITLNTIFTDVLRGLLKRFSETKETVTITLISHIIREPIKAILEVMPEEVDVGQKITMVFLEI